MDKDLDSILMEINDLSATFDSYLSTEETIQKQISDLKEKLNVIQHRRREVKTTLSLREKERASAERQLAIAAEQKAIEKEWSILKEEAEKLIAEMPWKDSIKPFQLDGAIQLASARRGLCGDVRGMGKTLTSIAWRELTESKKTLVLTKRRYAKEFAREIMHWEPQATVLPMVSITPAHRQVLLPALKNSDNYYVVANFEMWRRNKTAVSDLLSIEFDSLILDEAHQLKDLTSVTTKGFKNLSLAIPNFIQLTGTPLQNRPQELFTLLHLLHPELFPTETMFVRDYCIQIGQNKWGWQRGGLEQLIKKIDKFYVARTPTDVGHDVPPPAIHEYELDFDGYPEQEQIYKQITERSIAELKSGRAVALVSVLAVMTRQAQLTSWPAGITFKIKDPITGEVVETIPVDIYQSAKLDWAEDLIKELAEENQRVVLFSRFVDPILELQRRLNRYMSVAVIYGDTSEVSDQRIIRDFDLKTAPKRPQYQALLATYDTVGESVNLNSARHLIQLDRYWKPGKDDQAIGRIDRLNSMDQATVHRASITGTIDDFMIELIDYKREILNDFKSVSDLRDKLTEHLEKSL